jgi:hypothetical protein
MRACVSATNEEVLIRLTFSLFSMRMTTDLIALGGGVLIISRCYCILAAPIGHFVQKGPHIRIRSSDQNTDGEFLSSCLPISIYLLVHVSCPKRKHKTAKARLDTPPIPAVHTTPRLLVIAHHHPFTSRWPCERALHAHHQSYDIRKLLD